MADPTSTGPRPARRSAYTNAAWKMPLVVAHCVVAMFILSRSVGALPSESGGPRRHVATGYAFDLSPATSAVEGLEVQFDARATDPDSRPLLVVELSWDGGTSWTSVQRRTPALTSETLNYQVGSATDAWGRDWSPDDFTSDRTFRVRVSSPSGDAAFELGGVGVRVTTADPTDGAFDDTFDYPQDDPPE